MSTSTAYLGLYLTTDPASHRSQHMQGGATPLAPSYDCTTLQAHSSRLEPDPMHQGLPSLASSLGLPTLNPKPILTSFAISRHCVSRKNSRCMAAQARCFWTSRPTPLRLSRRSPPALRRASGDPGAGLAWKAGTLSLLKSSSAFAVASAACDTASKAPTPPLQSINQYLIFNLINQSIFQKNHLQAVFKDIIDGAGQSIIFSSFPPF